MLRSGSKQVMTTEPLSPNSATVLESHLAAFLNLEYDSLRHNARVNTADRSDTSLLSQNIFVCQSAAVKRFDSELHNDKSRRSEELTPS